MHEMVFAEQILETVCAEAARHKADQVLRVRLRVGTYSGIEPRSLSFCLEAIASDTLLENAVIDMVAYAAEVVCPACGTIPSTQAGLTACPRCGEPAACRDAAGIYVEEIELDVQENCLREKN